MPKVLTRISLAAGLTLAGLAGASASDIATQVYGDDNDVTSTGYGHGPHADFVIEGDGNDVEAVAGPCPSGRPSRTVLSESGQRRLVIAPCILD